MKDLVVGFAQLAAIIMILITLAVWTAAFSQWMSPEAGGSAKTANAQPQAVLVSDAGR